MTVRGLSKLQRKLRALPERAKDRISKALEESAEEIVRLAQNLVPIDEMTLYESIGWTYGDPPQGSISLGSVRQGRGRDDGLKITVFAGNDEAFYARWVEFGTKAHNVASGGGTVRGQQSLASGGGLGHPGASAQPFFYPAYRAVSRRVRSRITRATNRAAREEAQR